MRFPKHWAKASQSGQDLKGKTLNCEAWGWSFESWDEARQNALDRAMRAFEAFRAGRKPDRYAYGDRPVREEVVKTLGEKGEEIAVVTRNRYGALVLNSARVLFADVDFPQRKPAGFWDSLLLSLSAERKRRQLQSLESETIEAVRRWRQRNPSRTLRIYRTPAGLRIALTNQLYDPASADTLQVLRDLGSDPLYIKLSQTQACFRARLTPKPWRCGCSLPPNQYPWENAEAERLYRAWESDYANRSSGFRACKLVESLGDGEMAEEASAVLEIHDSVACGQDASKLA